MIGPRAPKQIKGEIKKALVRFVRDFLHAAGLLSYLVIATTLAIVRRHLELDSIAAFVYLCGELSFAYVFLNRLWLEIRFHKWRSSNKEKKE